ncbi:MULTISPECIES: ABC transporter substrate-binding protein [unclassified Geodermatophilus]
MPLRTRTAGCAAGLLVLAACSSEPDASASSGAASGSATDDQVVLALDDFAAMHALTLGVEPDLVLEVFEYESTSAVFDDVGLDTRPYGSELDLEAVAAASPDVVIGVSIPTTASVESQLDAIAPTTVVDYTAGWDEQLSTVAEALGREDEAAQIREGLQEATADLAADLDAAGLAGSVTSVVGDNGGFFSPPAATAVGSVLTGVGLARPPAQEQPGDPASPFVTFTAETLPDHDGDALFLLSGGPYLTDGLTGSPLWPGLRAVQAGAVHEVSGETWLSASAFSVGWVLDDLRAALLGEGEPATTDQAPARFAEFTGA